MTIDGKSRILGVLGSPVKHTLSPAIHNFLIEKYNINYVYLPLEVHIGNFSDFIKGVKGIENFYGFNVTVPYKVNIIKYLSEISPEAETVQAVNTVKIEGNKLTGFNTDLFGFKRSIQMNFPDLTLKGKKVLLIGSGGASKAAAYSLLLGRIKELVICNRTYQNARKLTKFLKTDFPGANITVAPLEEAYLDETGFRPDLIINSSSYGLRNETKPLLRLKSLKGTKTIVYDLIYNPKETALLRSALQYDLLIQNGLDMLILQALQSFSIWTSISIDELLGNVPILRKILNKQF
ncbi:MAG: shikimate dehydrogenase [Spirochaetes bacterium]|nr:shikimate dehydrogenase [Spirochaetota bacterium]